MKENKQKAVMRQNSVRDALRRQGMDDTPTQSGADEIDLITGKSLGVRPWYDKSNGSVSKRADSIAHLDCTGAWIARSESIEELLQAYDELKSELEQYKTAIREGRYSNRGEA